MSVVVQQSKITWQEHLASLEFVTVFFSWAFMLMTRLSEPLLMLATIYIICETAVPGLHSATWESASLAIMVTAPEFVLPGSFVVARHAKQNNEPLASWLNVLCWAFVVLMVATIADVLIFHLTGYWLAGLMFVRCSVAVGYSILMRVMQHGKQKEVVTAPVTQQIVTPQPVKISSLVTQVSIAKSRVKHLNNSSFSGFISMCSETAIEAQKPEENQAEFEASFHEEIAENKPKNKDTEPLAEPDERDTEEIHIVTQSSQERQYTKYAPAQAARLPICQKHKVTASSIKAAIKTGEIKANSEGKVSRNAVESWVKSSKKSEQAA